MKQCQYLILDRGILIHTLSDQTTAVERKPLLHYTANTLHLWEVILKHHPTLISLTEIALYMYMYFNP